MIKYCNNNKDKKQCPFLLTRTSEINLTYCSNYSKNVKHNKATKLTISLRCCGIDWQGDIKRAKEIKK